MSESDESLEPAEPEVLIHVEAAWARAIERRVAALPAGDSVGIPAEDVHARIRAALAAAD